MSADCLVLDKNWRPVDVMSWQNAIKLSYEGVAEIIKSDDKRPLHSQHFTIGMPRVIVVKNAWVRKMRKPVPCSRRNIYIRDNGECQYCRHELSLKSFTIDHVIPLCQGGRDAWDNLVLCCLRCNKHKAGCTPAQAGMRLINVPKQPKSTDPRFNFKLHVRTLRPEWREWESWLYWNISIDSEPEV